MKTGTHDHSKLDQTITASMQRAAIPGVACALVAEDTIPYARVFGVEQTSAERALTPDTLFQAASLSKPVFAYLVFRLIEQDILSLDRPLADYWRDPTFHDARTFLITARHVLSHTTGFPNWRDEASFEIVWTPGERFGYSGEGYEYLQHVIEHLMGQPLHVVINALVLRPLGMTHSTFAWPTDVAGNFQEDDEGNVVPGTDLATSSAAFSLLTTAHDYARFLRTMLQPDTDDAAHLSAASIQTMLTPQIAVGHWSTLHWGVGWGIQQTNWGDAFWHWGGAQNGYMNYVIGFPHLRLGLVLLTNSEHGLEICDEVTQAAFGAHIDQPAFEWLLPFDRWTSHPV